MSKQIIDIGIPESSGWRLQTVCPGYFALLYPVYKNTLLSLECNWP
jgi:hypothetical protein